MIKTAVLSFFFSLAGLVAGGVPGEPCPGCEFQRYDNEEEGFVFGVHISKYDTSPSTGLPGQFVIGEARCIGTNGNCVWTTTTCCSPTTPPCEMELKVIISNETGDSYGVFDPNRQNLPPACGPGNTEIPPVPPGSFENQPFRLGSPSTQCHVSAAPRFRSEACRWGWGGAWPYGACKVGSAFVGEWGLGST
jgi:hypothetical protein